MAGTGEDGFAGDGGPAAAARLSLPHGVAVDAAGNLYVADSGNNRLRRIGLEGGITTVAGTGEIGFSGDAGPATAARLHFPQGVAVDEAGNLYIADTDNHRVRADRSRGPHQHDRRNRAAGGIPGTAARERRPV